MKKIKNMRDLENEKLRLRLRRLELEKDMRSAWQQAKSSFKPGTYKKSRPEEASAPEEEEAGEKTQDYFGAALGHGAAWFTRQFVNNAGDKIEQKVQESVEGFVGKVRGFFRKKQ